MMTIHKIIEIQVPVWVDNAPTGDKETRTMVCFKRTADFTGADGVVLKTITQFGSMILNEGVTVEQAQAGLATADLTLVKFVKPNELGFFKAVV
jgi:hypothetical protein